jgi:hypothetical protein
MCVARNQPGTICPRPATPGFRDNLSRWQPPDSVPHAGYEPVWDNLSQTTGSSPGRPPGPSGSEPHRPVGTFCLGVQSPQCPGVSATRSHPTGTICLALAEPRPVRMPNIAHHGQSTSTTAPIVPCPFTGCGTAGVSVWARSHQAVINLAITAHSNPGRFYLCP